MAFVLIKLIMTCMLCLVSSGLGLAWIDYYERYGRELNKSWGRALKLIALLSMLIALLSMILLIWLFPWGDLS